MIDRTIPASDAGRKRSAKMLRRAVAVLLATTALGGTSAHAVDGTWIGSGDEWTDPTNWSSNPSVPDGTATFTVNTPTAVQSNGFVGIGSVHFTSTPNAQAYTITTNDVFVVNGAGVFNDSTNPQTFNTASTTLFQNSSTASGGSKTVTYVNSGAMVFQNSSTAGTATIANNSSLEFDNTSMAGAATITNNVVADFFDTSSAGTSKITNTAAATLTFHDNSTASASTITNSGAMVFLNSSSAGSASISTTAGSFATIAFNDTSTAGNSNIALVDGTLTFNNSSTAANATIVNNSGGTTEFGALGGADTGNAGTSHITNNNTGITNFFADSSAMNATIANNSGGNTNFQDQSTAGNATIVNNSGGTTTFGVMLGTDTASAGSSVIINNSGGTSAFFAATTAGSATIINSLGGIVQFGDSGGANDTATAGSSTIDNSGVVSFNSKTTAGTATITTHSGGNVFFFDTSSGGGARFITDAGGTVDISALTSAGTTAGSIEGAGSYVLGAKNFAVGSNNLSTQVSGVISGVGGSLTKVGTGTLILSGTNTYTGGTTISAGTLQLGNGGATGSIVGDILNNGILTANRSDNALAIGGAISGSGALNQNGTGKTTLTGVNTYTGATTINAGTLALSGAGSIANSSGVADNGTFDISGTAAGTSIKNLSGTGIVTLGNQTLTLTNASGTFAGAIGGGAGGLIKQGAGLFTLTGTNTYTGLTTVSDGNLRVNGSIASAVNVQSGATLSGIGSVGGLVTVQSGGTLSAGQSPGTLTLGALNLNAGSTSVFELGSPGVVGGPTNDLVNVTGNLTLGGTLSVNAPSAGYYRLFNYGTLTPSNFATVSGSSNGTPVVLTNVPNQVNLLIANAGQQIQFWDGADQTGNGVVNGGTGTWNASNTNWTGAPGQANFNDQWRSSVGVFSGTAGTVTIVGAQAFDTLQFSTTGYVLNAGAGGQLQLSGLSGTGTINTDSGVVATINAPIANGSSQSLAKVGGGTLILTAANTYTGGTTISGGTLQLGNGGASGSITGNVTDNAVFAINRSDAFTFSGVISGTGAFNQIGTGSTTLTNTNTYTGATTVSAGTLNIAAGGSITSNVNNTATFNNAGTVTGALFNNGTASNSGTITNGLTNVAGTTTNSGTINGGVSNVGTAKLNTTATSVITGGLINVATVNAQGQINGPIQNNLNLFNVIGTLSSDSTFRNGSNGTLNVNVGTYTVAGAVANFGVVNVAAGATLTATAAGITNGQLGSGITNKGTINGALTNNGQVSNDGTYNGDVTIGGAGGIVNNATGIWNGNLIANLGLSHTTNNGVWNGNVQSNDTTITNNLTWNGTVSNIGTVSGSLAIFNNNAAGTVSGLVTNAATTTNGGTLNGGLSNIAGTTTSTGTINGGLTNSATVNASGAVNGAIANNAGLFNVTGTLTGNSTFTNAAPATLAVGGAGAYTLQGLLSNSGAITVASGGQLIATVAGITNNAGGTITVAAGGTVKDDLNNAGAVTNNGAYFANIATNSGSVTNNGVWTGNVVSSTGTINNSGTWTGTVSNAGAFNNNAGATLSGLLTNTAGTTVNNGALNGGANVSGGTFAGSGTVANLNVSGGTFAPGNGTPGTFMTVTGNLAFQSGAMYLVALNPTTASFASVGGTATLNGSATAIYLAGNYVSKKYTILTAAGGVSGTFGSLVNTNVPANFTSTLSYDANNAYLNLALNFAPNPAPNFGPGLNINQQNVANTLVNFFNSTGGIPAVFGALTPGGLSQASGELATRTQQTSFDAMNLFLGLLTDPFVAGRGDGAAPTAGAPQFAESDDANAYAANGKARSKSEREAYAAVYRKASIRDTYDPRWSVWAAGYGGSQTTDGNAVLGSNNTRSSIGGVAVGADYRFSPNTLAGFAVAGGGTSFSVNGLGSGRSDLFQAGAFVRHTVGPAYISAALAYGWQDVTTDRTVTVAGSDLLRANFNANTFSGRAEGGYRFVAPWIGGVGITPYAAGQFTTIDLPAYAEQAIAGANTFALTYVSKSVTDTRSELGIRTDKSYPMRDGIFTLRGRAAWAHDFDPDRNIAATFQTLPGASFVVNGAAQARDAALVTGSAEMKWLNGFSLAATFEGEFSSLTRSYAGKGVVRYAW